MEQRTDQRDAAERPRRRHRGKPAHSRAAPGPHQEGLGDIVLLVRRREPGGPARRPIGEQRIAQRPRGLLEIARDGHASGERLVRHLDPIA